MAAENASIMQIAKLFSGMLDRRDYDALPALLAASGFGAQLGAFLALQSARRAAGVLLLIFGFWSIAGALMPLAGGHDMNAMGDMNHEAHQHHENR